MRPEFEVDNIDPIHTDDIQDIIGSPPSWLLRWGIALVLMVLVSIVIIGSFIRYPDIVQAGIRINAANAPKGVVSKVAGNILSLRVKDGEQVESGQILAWMESTADHEQVLQLIEQLQRIRSEQQKKGIDVLLAVKASDYFQLGELQNGYQSFYQSYLSYQAAIKGGIYLKRKGFTKQDIDNIQAQRKHLFLQQELQEKEYALAKQEFQRYTQLVEKKAISIAEYEQQQTLFLSKQYPLQQTQSALLANEASYTLKIKETADLDNQITEEKFRFMQALNSLISDAEQWKKQYVLTAPQGGKAVYAGIVQENQHVTIGQEIIYVNPGSTDFFGEITVPQYNMGKLRTGQKVQIKLNSYPFEEYGIVYGHIERISKVPQQDSIFTAKVFIGSIAEEKNIQLNTGLLGSADIITEDASLLARLYRNVNKVMNIGK